MTAFEESGSKRQENVSFSFNSGGLITETNDSLTEKSGRTLVGQPLVGALIQPSEASKIAQIFETPKLFPEQEFDLLLKDDQRVRYLLMLKPVYKNDAVFEIKAVGFPKPMKRGEPADVMDSDTFGSYASTAFQDAKKDGQPLSLLAVFLSYFKNMRNPDLSLDQDSMKLVLSVCRDVVRGTDLICRKTEGHLIILLPDVKKNEAERIAERLKTKITQRSAQENPHLFFLKVQIGAAEMTFEDTGIHTMLARAIDEAKRS